MRGKALRALGRLDECLVVWREALQRHVAAGKVADAGQVAWMTGVSHMWLGQFEDAFVAMHAGLEAVGDEPIPERLMIGGGLAALLGFAGMYHESR